MKIKRKVPAIFLLILLALTGNIHSQISGKINIAVMDLEAPDISASAKKALSDRLRTELFNTRRFSVMERNKMEEILKEQGFQQTGCTSDECFVEAGRLLGVDRIIAGSVGKVGTIYTVSLRMIDVETGRIMLTKTEDCNCPIEKVLTTSLRNVALKMAGMTTDQQNQPVIRKETVMGQGDFYFKSEPSGASVYLDDQLLPSTTPFMKEGVPAGTHQIRMEKGYYSGSQTVFLEANEFKKVELTLTKAKGGLKIVTQPFEAEIFLDNKSVGTSPATLTGLDAGEHILKLSKSGYLNYEKVITVEASKISRLDIKMEKIKAATLKVISQPPNCDIYVDGKHRGKTPAAIHDLLSGSVEIKITSPMHNDWNQSITLKNGEVKQITAQLKKKIGTLIVQSDPVGAEVFLDDVSKGKTPLQITDVEYGTHNLSVSKKGYQQQTKKIELLSAEPKTFSFNLVLAKGTLFINGEPSGANVFLNGNSIGKIPVTNYEISSGFYSLRVKAKGYEPYIEQINVVPDERKNISIRLTKKSNTKAFMLSFFVPGLGQHYLEKGGKSIMFALLELGALGGAYMQNSKYNQAIQDYNYLKDSYASAVDQDVIDSYYQKMETKYDEIDSAEKTRNILIGAAAGIWLWNVLDAALFGPETEKNIDLDKVNSKKLNFYAEQKGEVTRAGVKVNF